MEIEKKNPGKNIWISNELTEVLDKLKHPGQSYDGTILEIIQKLELDKK